MPEHDEVDAFELDEDDEVRAARDKLIDEFLAEEPPRPKWKRWGVENKVVEPDTK